jgi:hypothetical protein
MYPRKMKAHRNQKKGAQPKSETDALVTWKINTVNRKEYSDPYGPMEVSDGDGLHQHRNLSALSV